MSEVAIERFRYVLPRTAFSPREAARSGDVFRAFQDVAVEAATRRGWSPMRMRAVPSLWVVRAMTVVHARETTFGEPLEAASWVSRNRRGTLSTREVELRVGDETIACGTQEWAHLGAAGPCRMPEEMERDLGVFERGGPTLPPFEPLEGPSFGFSFEVWEGWMDPLGHVNHPQYVDFGDESILRRMRELGLVPLDLVPVADHVVYRRQIVAGERAEVHSRVVGRSGDTLVFDHRVSTRAEPRAAELRSFRRSLAPEAFVRELTSTRARPSVAGASEQ